MDIIEVKQREVINNLDEDVFKTIQINSEHKILTKDMDDNQPHSADCIGGNVTQVFIILIIIYPNNFYFYFNFLNI